MNMAWCSGQDEAGHPQVPEVKTEKQDRAPSCPPIHSLPHQPTLSPYEARKRIVFALYYGT